MEMFFLSSLRVLRLLVQIGLSSSVILHYEKLGARLAGYRTNVKCVLTLWHELVFYNIHTYKQSPLRVRRSLSQERITLPFNTTFFTDGKTVKSA